MPRQKDGKARKESDGSNSGFESLPVQLRDFEDSNIVSDDKNE